MEDPDIDQMPFLSVLMMVVAILVPATAVGASQMETDGDASTEHELSTAQERKVEMVAGYFAGERDFDAADKLVVGLRTGEPAMGWGVLSKLALYAAAGMEIDDLLSLAGEEDGGYSMGQLRKDYELGDYEELQPKNLGQIQEAEKPAKPEKADKKPPPGTGEEVIGLTTAASIQPAPRGGFDRRLGAPRIITLPERTKRATNTTTRSGCDLQKR